MQSVIKKRKLSEADVNIPRIRKEDGNASQQKTKFPRLTRYSLRQETEGPANAIKNTETKDVKKPSGEANVKKCETHVQPEKVPPDEYFDSISSISAESSISVSSEDSQYQSLFSNRESDSDDEFDSDSTLRDDADSTLENDEEEELIIEGDEGFDNETFSEASNQTELILSEVERKEIGLWFSLQYLEDIISYELKKESKHSISQSYCTVYDINPDRRETLVDWLISVQGTLHAGNSTLHLAVSLLDILLDRIFVPVSEMQAATVASFWVAYKFIHGCLTIDTMVDLCKGAATKAMVHNYELLILKKSNLLQTGGDTLTFFNYFLYKAYGLKFPPEIYYSGQYFLEIMLLNVLFVNCTASQRAVIAFVTAQMHIPTTAPSAGLSISRFINRQQLMFMYKHLFGIIKAMYSDQEGLKKCAIYRKYKSKRYYKISQHEVFLKFAKS